MLCLGNSFSNLPDLEGSLHYQKVALSNFRDKMNPGGIVVIDHFNFDDILTTGKAPAKNIYDVVSVLLYIYCTEVTVYRIS